MAAKDMTLPCPFCGDDVSVTLGPDAFVGEAWWGRCECGASYSCGPDGSPGFGHWDRCNESPIPLCPECMGAIGGACGGPDAPYRPALKGEACGAADCQGAPPPKHDAEYTDGPTGAAANGWDLPWDESEDDDDGEPDAYEVWNATGRFPK